MMKKIKLIWISLHPPYSKANSAGWQTFNFYFRKFKEDGRFDVRFVALCDKADQRKIKEENRGLTYSLLCRDKSWKVKIKKISNIESSCNPFNRYANLMSNYYVGQIFHVLKKYKKEGYYPDVIILEWTHMVVLAERIKKMFPKTRIIASEHDVTFVGYERKSKYYKGWQGLKWRYLYHWEKRVELRALHCCDLILPQNPDNMALLEEEGCKKDKLQWLIPYFNNMNRCNRKSNGMDILFFGAMSRPENYLSAIWFIEKVMPRLSDLNIRFVILGSNPPEKLREYANDRIFITGFVDSIIPYFEEAMCLVAPLVLGAGIKVKILEGLSSGVPVITNLIGIEGIPARPGEEYIHCESPEEYEEAIRNAYDGNLSSIGNAGKEFIRKTYDIDFSAENYKNKLVSLMEDK